MRSFDSADWKSAIGYMEPFGTVIEELRAKMEVASKPKEEIEEEDTEGVDLYKGSFSLAYGTLTLLRDAKMHLKRDRFYGLLGPNQCGWKMKIQLCAAQLMNADVLMLDEPTGHLDVDNIKWLEDWLESFPGSIICTSHFSPFLDKMCTHIIDFQDRKLKTFKGVKGQTLTQFVEKYPEKKAYFELSNEVMKFSFPEPGAMEGVKSRSKVILRMNNVSFQYPTKDKPTIMDVKLTVSQVSRVAVIGANGAGKSTAIKVLVGEQKPTEGSIWKAAGLRMAYVAQHAFHHLEKHMQRTPTDYIMWRFAGNDDRESLEFKTDELSVDEAAAREAK